jgi:hypothetical protein
VPGVAIVSSVAGVGIVGTVRRIVRLVSGVIVVRWLVHSMSGVIVVAPRVRLVSVVVVFVLVMSQVELLRSGFEQAVDGRARFDDLGLALAPRRFGSLRDAVSQVILEKAHSHLLQSAVRSSDLREDVDAVGVLRDQPLQPPHLPLYPPEPAQNLLLVLVVAVHVRLQTRTL